MKKKSDNSQKTKLRRKAEVKLSERLSAEQAGKKKAAVLPTTESDTKRLIHELEVHQIELEMQNEELLQSRAQVEAALRQYTDLYDFAPAGYFTLARDGAIHQVNLVGANLLGVERGALINRRFGVFVSVQSRTTFNTFLEKVFGSKQKKRCEVQLLKDGTVPHWMHVEGITNDRQECSAIVMDITKRKLSEEDLRVALSKYKTLFDCFPLGITVSDEIGNILETNPTAERLLSVPQDEQAKRGIDSPVWHIIRPGGTLMPPDEYASVRALKEKRLVENVEMGIVKSDNMITWINVSATPLPVKGYGVVITYNDITERKQTEEKLQESETRYRSVLQSATDAIVTADSGGIIVGWNSAAERIFGYSYTEAAGQSLTSLMPFYYQTGHLDGMKRVESGGDRHVIGKTVELEGLRKNKSVFPLELSLSTWETKEGHFFTGIIRDITERKNTQEVLRIKEERYRELFDNISSGVAVYKVKDNGEDFIFVDFNKTGEKLDGDRREDLIGKSIYEARPAIKEYGLLEVFKRVWKTGTAEYFPPKLYQDARLNKWYENFVYRLPTGEIVALYDDVTKSKRAEEALRESEEIFDQFLNNSPVLVYIKDENHRFNKLSKSFENLFGRPTSELIGKDLYDLLPPELAKIVVEDDIKVIKEGIEVSAEERLNDKYFSSIKFPIHRESGKPDYLGGFSIDITERKQMEEGLRQMQKLEGLGTLAGGIAHDFNNILGIILAYISGTKRFKDDATKLDLAVNTIVKAVERGKTLVQQILTFARKTEISFGAVNVNDVVMEIMNMIFETFPKILTYSQNFDKAVPYINADRSQLYQVLLNLCVNARDAMPSGGVLTINTRMVSSMNLRNRYPDAAASSYVCIEVSDTGEGMTEETRKRIFEPFFTTKGIGKGTGLGLAVVFGVVQSHKGFIDVESEIGKGTTFRLYLPVSQITEPISVNEKEESLEEMPGGTETLLIVEDEEMLLMSLRMVLVEKGYNVLTAGDGLKALKIYQEKKNDIALVLTDLGLPNISGLEVCRKVKEMNPNERMILATGFLDPDMKSEFLKAGLEHFLYKPYDLRKVLKEIREMLDEK